MFDLTASAQAEQSAIAQTNTQENIRITDCSEVQSVAWSEKNPAVDVTTLLKLVKLPWLGSPACLKEPLAHRRIRAGQSLISDQDFKCVVI
jgi:hypothetical protein